MANSKQFVCVKDRRCFASPDAYLGSRHCPTCGEPGLMVYYTWRPPKKDNDVAWKRIEAGQLYWDRDPKYDVPSIYTERWNRQHKRKRGSLIEGLLDIAYRKKRKQHSW